MAALLYHKVRTAWRHPAGAVGAVASVAVLCGSFAFVGNALPHVHAQENNPLYMVGSLAGTVTATTTFAARHLYVYRAEDKKLVAILRAGDNGHFGTTLVPGQYAITTHVSGLHDGFVATLISPGATTAVVVDTRDY